MEGLGQDDERCRAALDAIALFPSGETVPELLSLYDRAPSLRAAVFDLWRRLGVAPEPGRLESALGPDAAVALKAAAVRCVAEMPGFELERLEPWYRPLADAGDLQLLNGGEEPVVAAALWGGMVRGDPRVRPALRQAVANATDDAGRGAFLDLAALSGDPAWLPPLVESLRSAPVPGMQRLALLGSNEGVSHIIDGLSDPRCREAAETALYWLTGLEAVPRRPRLEVHSADGAAPVAAAGQVPDAQWVANWWRERRHSLPEGRVLFGRVWNVEEAARQATRWGGEAGHRLASVLVLASRGRAGYDADGLADARVEALESAGLLAPPVTPTVGDDFNPWEHGHYA
jgi:hypothetical protein